jgi:hypothetical protein
VLLLMWLALEALLVAGEWPEKLRHLAARLLLLLLLLLLVV